jgi:hypothetical protein
MAGLATGLAVGLGLAMLAFPRLASRRAGRAKAPVAA